MKIVITDEALKDYQWWQKNSVKKILRIHALLADIKTNPFKGIGKPEPLKLNLQGFWSRRIDREHRLIYSIEQDVVTIISCKRRY